jgi:hypothetical protein
MVQDVYFIPLCISKVLELLICGCALYCYYKVKILKKPPGKLILIELTTFFFSDQVQLFCLIAFSSGQISPTLDTIRSILFMLIYIAFWTCNMYETCLNFELYIRLKNSPMGQNYKKRERRYHIISISVGLISSIIAFPLEMYSEEYSFSLFGIIHIYFLFPIHFIIAIKLILEAAFIASCLYFYSKIRNPVKANKLKYNILYLCIFWCLIVCNMVASLQMNDNEGDEIQSSTIGFMLFCTMLKISLFIVRLTEPGLRSFIKDQLRRMTKRIASKVKRRVSIEDLSTQYDMHSSYLNFASIIEELKQEVRYSIVNRIPAHSYEYYNT